MKEILQNAQNYRKDSDVHHEEVIKNVKCSHECRDKMVRCFKEADRVRVKADEAHRRFLDAQEGADEAHRLYIRYLRDEKDFDRVITGLKRKVGEDWVFRERIEAKKRAKDIYERFRDGEKLSTEDLMQLQKSEMMIK